MTEQRMFEFMGLLFDPHWLGGLQDGLNTHMRDMMLAIATGDVSHLTVESGRRFCGCEACVVREILAFMLPKTVAAYETGKIRVNAK